jgi:acyl transferase domain-containing protein
VATLTNGAVNESPEHHVPVVNGHHAETNGLSAVEHANGYVNGESKTSTPQLFFLSAASEAALKATAANLQNWLASPVAASVDMKDLSRTLGLRRSQLNWRCGVVAATLEELGTSLSGINARKSSVSGPASTTFVFTGQGAQWYAMGCELMARSLRFRESICKSDQMLRALGCEWSLQAELAQTKEDSRVNEAEVAQPATTAIQIALVDLFASMAVVPDKVVGHSSGEIAVSI